MADIMVDGWTGGQPGVLAESPDPLALSKRPRKRHHRRVTTNPRSPLREEGTMLDEFKKFAMKGNMLDMAVGIIIGAAFSTIVQSLVNDVLMPPLGLLLGGVDFSELFLVLQQGDPAAPYLTLAAAQEAGAVTVNYGIFINAVVSFLIVAFAVFLLVRGFNRLREKQEEKPAEAPKPAKEVVLLEEIRDLLKAGR
ncbi:MAG: large conductance mechanosensitive channel protein MscL [Longimicrobiales bacterium]|nr:large conductance mechanosensitive channel protein MscL [Longimicrobiales bacterium]